MEAADRGAEPQIREFEPRLEGTVPGWVAELLGPARLDFDNQRGLSPLRVQAGARFCHVSTGFGNARAMDILTFQQRVVESYQSVFQTLSAQAASYPVRFWAFVPGIHDDLGAGLDRYMAFNAGRYGAYAGRFGRTTALDSLVPTASAVGIPGNDFVLHCLAADEPGLPVDNPRQIPAYRYSRRFGPMPPCFARATLLRGHTDEPLLLVGGTASITGEESQHINDLDEQTRETLLNLASVVACSAGSMLPESILSERLAPLLAAFQELRVYYTRPGDRPAILQLVRSRFPSLRGAQLHQASLCRQELLIEIEGLALLHRSRSGD